MSAARPHPAWAATAAGYKAQPFLSKWPAASSAWPPDSLFRPRGLSGLKLHDTVTRRSAPRLSATPCPIWSTRQHGAKERATANALLHLEASHQSPLPFFSASGLPPACTDYQGVSVEGAALGALPQPTRPCGQFQVRPDTWAEIRPRGNPHRPAAAPTHLQTQAQTSCKAAPPRTIPRRHLSPKNSDPLDKYGSPHQRDRATPASSAFS
jgi:hypothetical protein